MDVRRTHKPSRWRRLLLGAVAVAIGLAITMGLSLLPDRAEAVARETVQLAEVRRGTFVREVQARGTLVPELVHWVTATGAASVAEIRVTPGQAVVAGEVLVVLRNTELELAALEAERERAASLTALATLRAQADSESLALAATVAKLAGSTATLRLEAESTERLADKGLAARSDRHRTAQEAEAASAQLTLERKRAAALAAGFERRAASQRQELDTLVEVATFRRQQLEALEVEAPTEGVVQELPLEPGQWVTAGDVLAKIAKPGQLQAELSVPESRVSDVAVGQLTQIALFGATLAGRVARVDPKVEAGVVVVEVAIQEAVPEGARADVAVTGTIELDRVQDTLIIPRPPGAIPGGSGTIFVVDDDGRARRVSVGFGRASVREIEVVRGLAEGQTVMVGDTERFAEDDELVLEDE